MSQSAAGQDFTETKSKKTMFFVHEEVQIISHTKTYTKPTVEVSVSDQDKASLVDSELNIDSKVARLNPILRWKFILKNDPRTLVISILLFLTTIFALFKSFSMFRLVITLGLVGSANAASDASSSESHDPNFAEPFILLLVAGFSVWSLATISLSKSATNVAYAKDIAKIILGFLVGFFGGSRGK